MKQRPLMTLTSCFSKTTVTVQQIKEPEIIGMEHSKEVDALSRLQSIFVVIAQLTMESFYTWWVGETGERMIHLGFLMKN